MRFSIQVVLWTVIMAEAVAAIFISPDRFVTNFNADGSARTSFPSYMIPVFMLIVVAAIEFYRKRLRTVSGQNANRIANGLLVFVFVGMLILDVMNAFPELLFKPG